MLEERWKFVEKSVHVIAKHRQHPKLDLWLRAYAPRSGTCGGQGPQRGVGNFSHAYWEHVRRHVPHAQSRRLASGIRGKWKCVRSFHSRYRL